MQSLLAVGTNESRFGPGQVYVVGQKRVCVVLKPARRASIRTLQFCADKLIALDSKNDLSLFSLETRRRVASYAPPGNVTAVISDPSLDYCLIGLQNGGYGDLCCRGQYPDALPRDSAAHALSQVTS